MDLEKDAFGDVVHNHQELLESIEKYIENGFREEECHAKRRESLLPIRDHKNSERIYQSIKEAKIGKKFSLRGKL